MKHADISPEGEKMQQISVNDELILSVPDSFHLLSEEERNKMVFLADGPGLCLSAPALHLMISVGWRKVNGLAAMLLGEKDIAKNMEARVRIPMQESGYRLEGFSDGEIGGKKMSGYSYSYTVKGKGMSAQSMVAKNRKTIYYFHFYARAETRQEGEAVWKQILETARWT